MTISALLNGSGMTRNLSQMRQTMENLERQLATGKRTETYGGLGDDRSFVMSMRSQLSRTEGFQQTTKDVNLHLNLMELSLKRMSDITSQTRSGIDPNDFHLDVEGRTGVQVTAEGNMKEMLDLLNNDVAGTFLFSGRTTDTEPVEKHAVIMNGDGTRDGFIKVKNERLIADKGANGLGRLNAPTAAGGVTTLSQEHGNIPFGFTIAGASSPQPGKPAISAPTGATNQVTFDFNSGLPAAGDKISLTVNMPDGTSKVVELTATRDANPKGASFQVTNDPQETADNFRAKLEEQLKFTADTALTAASASQSANEFFDIEGGASPKRVDAANPAALATATGIVDAPANSTVVWYKGDSAVSDVSNRDTRKARIDDNTVVSYGARATDPGLVRTLKALATFSSTSFSDSGKTSTALYQEMGRRTRDNLTNDTNVRTVDSLRVEMGTTSAQAKAADERHKAANATFQGFIDEKEGVNVQEVGVKILAMQTKLQASYQVTANLAKLSLVNYI